MAVRGIPRLAAACAIALAGLLAPWTPAARAASGAGAAAASAPPARSLRETPRLLGDPWGARSRLESLGVSLQLFFNTYLGAKVRGGADPGDVVRNSGTYDLFTRVDLEELAGVQGLDLLAQVKGGYGRNANPQVGALSDPIDDADFDEPIYLAQLWAEQSLLGQRLRVRAGYLDQQTILDRNAYANTEDVQFMSTFLDNSPIVPLKVGLGAALFVQPVDWLELAIGTADADNQPRGSGFDTAFDGADSLMGYAELAFQLRIAGPRGPLPGAYRLGAFLDGSERAVLSGDPSPGAERGHAGFYLSLDQLVFRERRDDTQGIGVFARYGVADDEVNPIARFWSVGLQVEGLLPGRDADVLGLGAYQAIGSDRRRRHVDPAFDRETGVEVYYRIALLPWLALTPDVQLIENPGGSRTTGRALVLVLRARLSF